MLVWERGDGALWIFSAEVLVEEDEVCEAAPDLAGGFLKGCKIRLSLRY
jgi:hypothetical protein